jgi:hypothetical protein
MFWLTEWPHLSWCCISIADDELQAHGSQPSWSNQRRGLSCRRAAEGGRLRHGKVVPVRGLTGGSRMESKYPCQGEIKVTTWKGDGRARIPWRLLIQLRTKTLTVTESLKLGLYYCLNHSTWPLNNNIEVTRRLYWVKPENHLHHRINNCTSKLTRRGVQR